MNPTINFLENISSTKTAYVIILIFAITVYSRSFSAGFVNFDDSDLLRDSDFTGTASGTFATLNKKSGDNFIYRPISLYTSIIDYSISGEKPRSYHVTNLIIHVLTCMGLFHLLKMLRFDREISFLMALLFTVHPLFNQTVAWIPPRADLLMGFFGILSIMALIKFIEGNKWIYLSAHLTAFSLSVFSKETAILFPTVYVLFCYFRYYNKSKIKFINLKNLSLIAGWILIAGLFLYLRSTLINEPINPKLIGIPVFLSNIRVIPEFIAKFFIPIKLNAMPQFSVFISSIGILIIAGIAIFAKVNRKDLNDLSFIGILWFLVFTAITMVFRHSYRNDSFDYLEHRTYLPAIGLIIFMLSLIKDLWKERIVYALIPLILAYSVYSFVNTRKFESPMAFYNSIIYEGTKVAVAYYGRGFSKESNGDKQGAIEDYAKAISIRDDFAAAYYKKGNVEHEMKNHGIAIHDFTKAIKSRSNFADAYLSRGAVYYECGVIKQNNGDKQGAIEDYLLAIDDYINVLKINPDLAGAYSNRGDVYFKINRREDAIADYKRAIKLNPKYSGFYNNLGILYGTEGNYPESIKFFSKAIICDNKFGNAYLNRGLAYLYSGDKQKACEDFKLSIECGNETARQLYEKHCR
jgi:tetratricopeptide (TPR) repeat protein